MAKTNQTYYNKQGIDFSGMFDAGQDFTPVDWSTITSDLVDKIATETKRRETKKADIQTKTDALMTDLRDYQAGANNTFNGYVLDGSTQVKDYMLMQNKLLKNGKLDPNAYVRSTQLLQDDWNSFQTAVESFNVDYAAAIEKANSGDLSALGDVSFNKMQSATDIQSSRIVVSTDGRMYSQNKDGELVGFGTLNGRQKDLPMNWNVQSEVKSGFTDNIGRTVKAFGRMTVESAIQSDEFKKAEATYIEGIIGSIESPNGTGRDFLSILTNHHGYTLTEDPTEAEGDTKKILIKADSNGMMQPDPTSLYTAENRKLAEETIRNSIRSQLDYIEKPGGTDTPTSDAQNVLDKKREDVYGWVANLISNDGAKRAKAKQDIFANFPEVADFETDDKGIWIKLKSGGTQKIPWEDAGEVKTPEELIDRLVPVITGQLDATSLKKIKDKYRQGLDKDGLANFSTNPFTREDDYDITESRTTDDFTFSEDVITTIGDKYSSIEQITTLDFSTDIAAELNKALASIPGHSIEVVGEEIQLRLPNNEVKKLGNPQTSNASSLLNSIQNYIMQHRGKKNLPSLPGID